MNSGSQEMH